MGSAERGRAGPSRVLRIAGLGSLRIPAAGGREKWSLSPGGRRGLREQVQRPRLESTVRRASAPAWAPWGPESLGRRPGAPWARWHMRDSPQIAEF